MRSCSWIEKTEAWFDGQSNDPEGIAAHVQQCPTCSQLIQQLEGLRQATTTISSAPEISDAQFHAFMDPIHDRITQPRTRFSRFWALVSLSAAALIVAVATLLMLSRGPHPVAATVVESCSTELQGATVTSYATDNGVATIWVSTPSDDVQGDIL